MTIALIILFVCFTLAMAWQTLSPFLGGSQEQLRFDLLEDELRQVEELTTRKNLYLDNLREIEIDRELDKLAEKDYVELKRRYERETVRIMRELDDLHGGRGWESRVEDALTELSAGGSRARLPEASAKPTESKKSKKPKTDKASTKKKKSSKASKPSQDNAVTSPSLVDCPECGKEREANAKFCSECGATLVGWKPLADTDDAQISAAE